MTERLDDLVERLERIVGDLDDLAFDELRAAVAGDGDPSARRATDRTLVRARRAVEKAAVLLRDLADGPGSAHDRADDHPS